MQGIHKGPWCSRKLQVSAAYPSSQLLRRCLIFLPSVPSLGRPMLPADLCTHSPGRICWWRLQPSAHPSRAPRRSSCFPWAHRALPGLTWHLLVLPICGSEVELGRAQSLSDSQTCLGLCCSVSIPSTPHSLGLAQDSFSASDLLFFFFLILSYIPACYFFILRWDFAKFPRPYSNL